MNREVGKVREENVDSDEKIGPFFAYFAVKRFSERQALGGLLWAGKLHPGNLLGQEPEL